MCVCVCVCVSWQWCSVAVSLESLRAAREPQSLTGVVRQTPDQPHRKRMGSIRTRPGGTGGDAEKWAEWGSKGKIEKERKQKKWLSENMTVWGVDVRLRLRALWAKEGLSDCSVISLVLSFFILSFFFSFSIPSPSYTLTLSPSLPTVSSFNKSKYLSLRTFGKM